MCGIFGLIANGHTQARAEDLKRAIPRLIKLSEPRGREATGMAIAFDSRISIYKRPMKPSAMIRSRGFADFLDSCIAAVTDSSGRVVSPLAVIGHTRLVTNGSQAIDENNQPARSSHLVGVHNGIITNDRDLACAYPELGRLSERYAESDTKVFVDLIDKFYEAEGDILKAVRDGYKKITGSASIALVCDDLPAMILATNTGSLYFAYSRQRNLFVFGSERCIMERFLRQDGLARPLDPGSIQNLAPFSGAVIPFSDIEPEIFLLKDNQDKRTRRNIIKNERVWAIIEASSSQRELRRCARCVLPETYPFISFDTDGVCNYCRKYQRQRFHGREALESILQNYRSKDGRPDCIVGFSGGRDSSYGLHLLKTEFGMHPIAYTYDWAMVTDLARRNQAKVVGRLGIEHIIRAADIHTKRRYIRKNIYAWLKNPELGMVPLFMAGDKMFYYYGRQLREETGIKLTVFASGHQLEQMEFKVGFCGIDQDLKNNTKLYHFDLLSKLRLAMWYVFQYLINPSYINESLFDSIFAFYASFINKDDYLYLYRYIPWDEKIIEKTLREGYAWESDEQYGKNQWRMGDGHTAFIDYIYHTVAGFSEFDNFRSNQIREGLVSRKEALAMLKEDNKPRIGMLQDFSQLIGFNLEEVLLKINSIPKMYR